MDTADLASPVDLPESSSAVPARPRVIGRRHLIALMGGAAVAAACGGDDTGSPAATTTRATNATSASTTAVSATRSPTTEAVSTTAAGPSSTTAQDLTATPAETGGPFPADGTNDNGSGDLADVLSDPRSVRVDIRGDLDGTNVQAGVPLTLTVNVRKKTSGAAYAGAAVYVWHCNQQGAYSAYNSRMLGGDYSDRSFLRGVQIADASGVVRFDTILPGRYPGRAFHIHFEVFSDASYGTKLLTSQMAMDDETADRLYDEAGYTDAARADTDNDDDNVFGDGVEYQMLAVSGDVGSGLRAEFTAVV